MAIRHQMTIQSTMGLEAPCLRTWHLVRHRPPLIQALRYIFNPYIEGLETSQCLKYLLLALCRVDSHLWPTGRSEEPSDRSGRMTTKLIWMDTKKNELHKRKGMQESERMYTWFVKVAAEATAARHHQKRCSGCLLQGSWRVLSRAVSI